MDQPPLSNDIETEFRPLDRVVLLVLVVVALGGIVDLILDRPASWWSAHVLLELTLVATSITLASTLWLRWRDVTAELGRTQRSLLERNAEREAWQAKADDALRSMRHAVQTQFDQWALTPTEREIALFLLQGVGHRQIAARTGRSERTVRQHAVSVYDKSGLDGRAALAGFFLQGLSEGDAGKVRSEG